MRLANQCIDDGISFEIAMYCVAASVCVMDLLDAGMIGEGWRTKVQNTACSMLCFMKSSYCSLH